MGGGGGVGGSHAAAYIFAHAMHDSALGRSLPLCE